MLFFHISISQLFFQEISLAFKISVYYRIAKNKIKNLVRWVLKRTGKLEKKGRKTFSYFFLLLFYFFSFYIYSKKQTCMTENEGKNWHITNSKCVVHILIDRTITEFAFHGRKKKIFFRLLTIRVLM
jgi:hypothetical protein